MVLVWADIPDFTDRVVVPGGDRSGDRLDRGYRNDRNYRSNSGYRDRLVKLDGLVKLVEELGDVVGEGFGELFSVLSVGFDIFGGGAEADF